MTLIKNLEDCRLFRRDCGEVIITMSNFNRECRLSMDSVIEYLIIVLGIQQSNMYLRYEALETGLTLRLNTLGRLVLR